MAFFIFVLFVCVAILFNNFFNLRKNNDYIESLIQSYKEDNGRLRKEIAEIKEAIEGKTITIEKSSPIIEEIKPQEIESIEDSIIETVKENADFPPVIETIEPEEESIDSNEPVLPQKIEEEIFTYESKTTPRLENQIPIEEEIYEESAFSKFLKNAEKQFADNWTGILGTAIMVLGIGYLNIYTALTVSSLLDSGSKSKIIPLS